jgi:hypothetical protein
VKIESLEQLASVRQRLIELPEVTQEIARRAAPRITELAQQAFDAQTSPYGDPWAAGKDGKDVDLNESGALREKAIRYEAQGRGIRVSVASVKHAKYQLRFGILPAKGSIPAAWEAEIAKIAEEVLQERLNG